MLCQNMTKAADKVAAYIQYVKWIFNLLQTDCKGMDTLANTKTEATPDANQRQWYYQSCIEFGYFQSAPAKNSLRSTRITVDWHLDACKVLFGYRFVPDITYTNNYYGGNKIRTSNTFFVNGQVDPWTKLSIVEGKSATVQAYVIAGGSHCNDLRASQPTDPDDLKLARAKISDAVGKWLTSSQNSTKI